MMQQRNIPIIPPFKDSYDINLMIGGVKPPRDIIISRPFGHHFTKCKVIISRYEECVRIMIDGVKSPRDLKNHGHQTSL